MHDEEIQFEFLCVTDRWNLSEYQKNGNRFIKFEIKEQFQLSRDSITKDQVYNLKVQTKLLFDK